MKPMTRRAIGRGSSGFGIPGISLLAAVALTGCGEGSGRGKPESDATRPATGTVAAATSTATPPAVVVTATRGNGQKLVGRWRRPDGGYVLDVRKVEDATGAMEVAYLNPNPIHVAQAKATEEGGKLNVFVELQDVNYPGATYRLTYVPPADQLIGIYYQPAVDQSFEVEFVRMR